MPYYTDQEGYLVGDSKEYYADLKEKRAKERKQARLKRMREKEAQRQARTRKADKLAESQESVTNKIRARREKNQTIMNLFK